MCGRVALFTPPARLARILDAACVAGLAGTGAPGWHASYNVGPTATLLGVVAASPPTGEGSSDDDVHRVARGRQLAPYRWGLVPPWADDPRIGARLFNARAETVATKPAFRHAFRRRRLVVPVDGFYEWGPVGRGKRPHYFRRADGGPVLLAGLWEAWAPKGEDGAPLRTCTVITTAAGEDMEGLHDRMPVVLEADRVDDWIDPDLVDDRALASLLVAAPAGTLAHHAVDRRVGSIRNDGPDLVEPASD